jgi:hypothetical protein
MGLQVQPLPLPEMEAEVELEAGMDDLRLVERTAFKMLKMMTMTT